MRQYLGNFDYVVWLVTAIMQWILFGFLLGRGVAAKLPRFGAFLLFVSIKSTVLIAIAQWLPYRTYFWTFYAGMMLETFLLIAVLYDIFLNTFDPVDALPSGAVARLIAGLAIFLVITLTLAELPAFDDDVFGGLCRTIHRSAVFVICCWFWTLVVYARHLGIPWRSRVARIATGFLFYMSVKMVTTAGVAFSSHAIGFVLSRATQIAFQGSLLIWLWAALQKDELALELPAPASLVMLQGVVGTMQASTTNMQSHPLRAKTARQ